MALKLHNVIIDEALVLRLLCSTLQYTQSFGVDNAQTKTTPSYVYQSLMASLVLMRLDYGNATLAVTSARLVTHLQ